MANNKVQLADGTTLIDLTSDTVTPQTMLDGITAHAANGEQITGVVNLANAGTNIPLADSDSGSVGAATAYAREDHVHPFNYSHGEGDSFFDGSYQGLQRCLWTKNENVVTLYLNYNRNLSGTYQRHGTIKESFCPKEQIYAIGTIFNASAPYEPIGSLWIYQDGACSSYWKSGTTPSYAYVTYAI